MGWLITHNFVSVATPCTPLTLCDSGSHITMPWRSHLSHLSHSSQNIQMHFTGAPAHHLAVFPAQQLSAFWDNHCCSALPPWLAHAAWQISHVMYCHVCGCQVLPCVWLPSTALCVWLPCTTVCVAAVNCCVCGCHVLLQGRALCTDCAALHTSFPGPVAAASCVLA